jgi:CRISPR-associated protein Csm3
MKLLAIYRVNLTITLKSGLHIGGNKDGLEMRGINNPVIRDPLTQEPYIPGSSLKGKLRHLIEQCYEEYLKDTQKKVYDPLAQGIGLEGKTAQELAELDKIGRVFGQTPVANDDDSQEDESSKTQVSELIIEAMRLRGPTRLLVRDCVLEENSRKKLIEHNLRFGVSYTEVKPEVYLPRLPGGPNFRSMERVPTGTVFSGEMLYRIFDNDGKELADTTDHKLFGDIVLPAIRRLRTDALGGSGSRGYGQVKVTATAKALDCFGTELTGVVLDVGDLAPVQTDVQTPEQTSNTPVDQP